MSKKKKGIIIAAISVAIVAAIGVGLFFLFGPGGSSGDVGIAEGEIYRTKTESFWVGVGKAYISFQHREEPENKSADDTELYGDVFYIMVSSGDSFDPWLIGNYSLDEAGGTLMMTASWDETAGNQTKLADAKSGEEKIYTAENGEYRIPVELPSAKVTFILNPSTDKVGNLTPPVEGEEPTAATEPEGVGEENTGNLFARLSAEDSLFDGGVRGCAQIDMAKDGTWSMKIKVEPYVPDYVQAVSGSWEENSDGSVTLTVEDGDYKDSLVNTFALVKGDDGVFTGAVEFTADKENGIVFHFNFESVDISDTNEDDDPNGSTQSGTEPDKNTGDTPATAKGEIYRTPVFHGIYSGIVGDAYISFLDVDTEHSEIGLKGKIFGIYVDAGDGYSPWISGYWELSGDDSKLTLTQNGAGDAGLTGAQADTPKTYTAENGVFTVEAYFPGGGAATLTFNPETDAAGGGQTPDPTPEPEPEPEPKPEPEPAEAGDIVLNATDSIYDGQVTCNAVLTVKTDGTWNMTTTVYGNTIENAVIGTWVENSDKSLTLTVTEAVDGADLTSPFQLTYDSATGKYTGTVELTCNGEFTFSNLNFVSGKVETEEPSPTPTPDPDPEPAPETGEELYKTPVYHGIYSGVVGDVYISFLDTGKFEMYVDAGQGYSSWLDGAWSLNGEKTELTLMQDTLGDAGLTGAEAGVGKVYTAENGVFTIEAYFPSNGTATLTFNPETDAAGGGQTPDPTPEPEPEPEPSAEDIVLTASDSLYEGAVTCDAVMTVKTDGTWSMDVTVYNNPIQGAASGTWVKEENGSLTLTTTQKADGASLADTITLSCDPATGAYSGTVALNCMEQFDFNLNFSQG